MRAPARAPPCWSVLVAPRHPFRCRALPVGTWCAAGRPESPRAGQSEVTSPPCAVWWVSPCAADPWKPPRHLQCLQYTLSSLTGAESTPLSHLFALSVQIPRSGPCNTDWSAPAPSFRPATVAPGRWSAPSSRSCRPRTAPAGPQPPRGRGLDRSCAAARCRCSPPLTCARQPTWAPAARRRRVGERPRAAARARCVTPSGVRSAPRWRPRTGPSAAWGRDLAPPGTRQSAARPDQVPAPLRSAADPLLNGAPVPVGRGSAPRERPYRPDRHAPTARPPRSAPPGGAISAPWRARGTAPRPCSAHQCPSAPCRCSLRAASTCMSTLGQPGSRSAARHQRRSAPRCACADVSRPAGGPR